MNETMDSSEQLERQGDAKPNDFSQLDPEGEHQTITPDENSSQVHRGEGGDASPSDQSQELLGDGNDDTSNGAQPHDSNTSRAKVDIVEPAKPSLPESTTPSHESKEHEQEVEKQEFNQPASIPAEQHIESHDGADAPKDEDKIPQEPAPAVINNQTTGPNTESSEPQVNSDPQRADIEENENPVDPSGSSLEASAGPEDPAPGDGLPEPPPDVGEESIEQEASIERDPDDALNPEAPALKDVSLSQSESDLNETTPLVEAESSPIAPTESELSQTVEDKEESGSQLGLKTESPPKVLPGDLVEVPASSQETEKQPDQTPLLGNESIGEQIPQEAINLNEANGEEEEISKEMHSPDQSAELLSLDSETDNHGDLQSKSPSNPEQEEQLGSKSSGTLEEPEQPDENETFEGTEEEDSHKIPREALESVEIPSVTSQDQTSLDQTGQYAPVLAEQNELMSQPLTVNSQQSETDGKGEEAIEKAQEQEPAPSPSPPLTESLTGPFQSSIHKNSESQDITLSEPALAQETESQQDPDPHEDASSRPSQIPPDHEPAAIKEPEPEPTPSEIIQGEPSVPEKLNTEAQTVSYEQIVVEQTSATPVDDQVSVETQNSEDHVSIDSIRTKEQATTEDHPKEEFPTELPVLSQPQGNEAEETADDNSQVDPEEPAIEVADKADKEPEASGPIQEQAPADSQAPVNKMSTEDQPMEDKSTVDTPVEGQVPAGSQPSIGGWASIEDKEVAENGTPVSPSTSEEHSGNIIPAAVDLPTEQLPDQPPESDLQEPQDHNIETAERSDQAIVTEDPSNASNEFDGEVVVPEFTEGQTLDKPASGPIAEANTEQLAGEETKGELLSTATVLDEAQGNELVEDTDPKDKPIPEEPEVIHIQDNQNEVPDTRLLDSATNEQVPPQEPELSSESIVLSRPQENKDAEATIPSDKAVSGGPEAVHIQDNQSGEPNSISSDPSTQDPNPSQEHNPADQIFIESDNEAEILPNTSLGDTTQPITTDPKAPIDDSSKQLITQDFEGYAPDKDVDGLEQPEITHEELSALVTSPQFPENNDDKAAHRAQAEPKQVQPTEISEPARADVIVDIKEAVIDEDPAHDTSETLNLGDVPSLEAAGNDSPAVAGDLAPPPDKTDQSIEVIQQEAENSSKQPHSEITTPDQSQRIQEDTTGLGDNPVPEESLSDIIAPDQTQEHEETTRGLGDKAVLVEPVNNNKPRPIRAPKENTRVIEEVKAEKIRSYDESKDTVGPIPTDGGPIRMASKGEDQLFSSLVGDTPGVGDIESFNRSLAQNHPGTLSEQSNDGEPSFISPLEVQDATEARNRSLALQHNPDEEMEAFPGARLAEDARILSSADNTATPQVQEHEGGSSEIPEALELNIRSGSKDLPDITTDTSDEDEFLPGSNQEQTSEESLLAIPETSIHDEPIEGYQDSSFVNISSADLENSPGLTPQEPNKDGDHDILAFSKELQPEISGVVASKPLETGRDSGSKELSLQQKSEFVPSDTPEVLDITKVSDDPLASTKVKRLAYNLEAAKGHLNMVKLGIFRPTAFTVAGGALTRRHPVESDDEQAASGLPLNSAEVPVKKPAEPEPVAVSRDLSPLEKSISSLPSEGDEECNPPQRLSKPADPVDTPILTRGKPDRETKSVWNDPSHQTTESQQELAHFITPESPEIVASVIPLSESFTVIERGPIPQNSSRRTLRPPLVHSSTQTEDDRDFGSQPSWSFINLTDLEPRSKTPGIILPDLTDSKARALGRVKSVRKQRRQTLKKAEEAVAAAVILYAAAQELSPSSSSLLGSPQVENSTGETREPTRKGTQEAGVFFPADVVTGNQSVGQNDYSLPVADLSTDDEEKKSADERHHRHRRHHHHHHHSSRSKDVKGSGEHLHPRNTRIESNHSIKSSSDRSIPQTPKRDSGFSVESSHNTDTSHPRHRTPEEQAAHERRKEERRIAREAYDMAREDKGKDSEAPPSDRHSSHRSSRRYSLPHSEKSHTERRSERFQPERYSERSQPEKYPERSFSERHSERPSERPQPERYSERSHSERHPAKDSASSSNKRFFDMRHGESSLASTYVPRTRSNSTNVPPPVFKEPSKSSGLLKRTNTGKSSKSHRESGEIPRPRSHRSHDHDHDQDASSKRRRSEAKISGSLESTSSKTTPPSPTKDEHRQLRQKERQKAREATEAAEAKKKSGGIRAAFKKLFS
ncbi:hypothetical protein F4814DRAFT_116194 [Daldinia grandis]|nr:hypothetical protein F4814DRAFT_116194 [Daldinia grandis]